MDSMECWSFHPSEAGGLPGLLPGKTALPSTQDTPTGMGVHARQLCHQAFLPPHRPISTPSTALRGWSEGQLPRLGSPLRSARAQSHSCPEETCPQAPRGRKYSVALVQLSLLYDLNKYLLVINSDQGQP